MDLSLSNFETQRHVVNNLLISKNLFLRVYEPRKSFATLYLIKKVPKGKNIIQRDLSACVEECFNDFELVKKLTKNERKQLFKAIDIVYRPVSKINQVINCYFSKSMRNTYRILADLKPEKTIGFKQY